MELCRPLTLIASLDANLPEPLGYHSHSRYVNRASGVLCNMEVLLLLQPEVVILAHLDYLG